MEGYFIAFEIALGKKYEICKGVWVDEKKMHKFWPLICFFKNKKKKGADIVCFNSIFFFLWKTSRKCAKVGQKIGSIWVAEYYIYIYIYEQLIVAEPLCFGLIHLAFFL